MQEQIEQRIFEMATVDGISELCLREKIDVSSEEVGHIVCNINPHIEQIYIWTLEECDGNMMFMQDILDYHFTVAVLNILDGL